MMKGPANSNAKARSFGLKGAITITIIVPITILIAISVSAAQEALPVLEFPESGLDHPAAYLGYKTRFFWDSEGNAFQIYLNQRRGRVVHAWANAANESVGFTARDTSGQPATLSWGTQGATVHSSERTRYVEYSLTSESSPLEIGLFLLGSMRKERDFQYQHRHLLPLDEVSFLQEELVKMISNLEHLQAIERSRHLALLGAKNIQELHTRLHPVIDLISPDTAWIVRVEQVTFDGKNRLSLELNVDRSHAVLELNDRKISIRSLSGGPIHLMIRVATNSSALTPLRRDEIFNRDFLQFYEQAKAEHDSVVRLSANKKNSYAEKAHLLRFRWLDRQVRSMELLSYQEKLMAGLPNFATYFGRDMMMSALMMEPIWSASMLEHVIASVLRKVTPSGEVSHEESLGGQAIRENSTEYNKLIRGFLELRNKEETSKGDSLLVLARTILGNLQSVRENYNMVDDDFQLPILVARYLSNPTVAPDRKRAFMLGTSSDGSNISRLALLMRNLMFVSRLVSAYIEHPEPLNLVSFPKLDELRWFPGSWRDSGAGYAGGRFAMDINAIWAPKALESVGKIFDALGEVGFTIEDLESFAPEIHGTKLVEYARNPESLRQAVYIWKDAVHYFEVTIHSKGIRQRLQAKLDWLPETERRYWEDVLAESGANMESLRFLALSLDDDGAPIPVVNTDPATLLFLEDFTGGILNRRVRHEQVLKIVEPFLAPYPVGLFVEDLGPLVANDAYASQEVWENYKQDDYHSPRVVWGREVNLLLLGLTKQILAAFDSSGKLKNPTLGPYIKELNTALNKTLHAVETSGLKHNELWRYRIEKGKLVPIRYASSSDIQLWNLTDLAVQFLMARIPGL